jgi:hypothetical protein
MTVHLNRVEDRIRKKDRGKFVVRKNPRKLKMKGAIERTINTKLADWKGIPTQITVLGSI